MMPFSLSPLTRRLRAHAKERQLDSRIIELDYLLSWLLKSVSEDPILGSSLVFKGGTALKKCYFGSYRFSEDLDFTALPSAPTLDQLERCVEGITKRAEEAMCEYAPITLQWSRYSEKEPHPDQQEAFKIRAQFPNQREPLISAMIEVSFSEELLFPPHRRAILHDYGENIQQEVLVYSLEEIVIEKLRGILQHTRKLHEKGWTRSRTRDYYDLYRLLHYDPSLFEEGRLVSYLKKKCASKQVSFQSMHDFFDPKFLKEVQKDWTEHLGYLMKELPPIQGVFDTLREGIGKLVSSDSINE